MKALISITLLVLVFLTPLLSQAEGLTPEEREALKKELKQEILTEIEKEKTDDEKNKPGALATSIGNHISLYGRARLDYSFDSSRTVGGASWAFWVMPNYSGTLGPRTFTNTNGYEANISPRNSRLGLMLKNISFGSIGASLYGRFEIDFNGGDRNVETWMALPRLRIAKLTFDWGWGDLTAGNDWDTFSTQFHAYADDQTTPIFGGSVGFRRTMIRLSFKPMLGEHTRLWVQAAVARPFDLSNADFDGTASPVPDPVETDLNGDNTITEFDEYGRPTGEVTHPTITIGDGNNDGEDSMIPMIQWRVAADFIKLPWTKDTLIVGVGGHWQRASFNRPVGSTGKDYLDSWHVDTQLSFPIIDQVAVHGEAYYGVMVADILGGVFQDVNPDTGEAISSMGGWVDVLFKPFDVWYFALGYNMDKPDADDLKATTVATLEKFRYSNGAVFFSNMFNFGGGFKAGLAYLWMTTNYRLSRDGESVTDYKEYSAVNHRVTANVSYNF